MGTEPEKAGGVMGQQRVGRLGRRAFLTHAAVFGVSVSAVAGALDACGAAVPAPAATATGGQPSAAPAQINGTRHVITALTLTYGNPPPADGPGLKQINDRFNIDFRPQFIPQGSYTEKLSAVIAGGDIPDVMGIFGPQMPNFYKWATQGAFLAVDDLVKGFQAFSYISDPVWNNVRVKGKRHAIPQYYPPYALTPSIRQDWLDNLGLKMPTSYEELKQVALAFTTGDPAKDGNKHYGIAIGADINPSYAMGAYWDDGAWYHKDQADKYLPGGITAAAKERIKFLADLYQQGAITRDFAVIKNWPDVNKEFYGGRAGIFIGAPRGMSQDYMHGLLEIHPNARPVPIYPFKAPDSTQGFAATSGYSGVNALSAKLAKEQDKVQRILALLDFNRKFYPDDQQNAQNPDYDWLQGRAGQGYDVVNGKVVLRDGTTNPQGLAPLSYMVGGTAWPPTDDAINYQAQYLKEPRMGEWAGALQKMWSTTKSYNSPHYGVISATQQAKGGDLQTFLLGEQTKMIGGQRPVDSWDELVKEYLAKGGQQVIDEINQGIAERDKA